MERPLLARALDRMAGVLLRERFQRAALDTGNRRCRRVGPRHHARDRCEDARPQAGFQCPAARTDPASAVPGADDPRLGRSDNSTHGHAASRGDTARLRADGPRGRRPQSARAAPGAGEHGDRALSRREPGRPMAPWAGATKARAVRFEPDRTRPRAPRRRDRGRVASARAEPADRLARAESGH